MSELAPLEAPTVVDVLVTCPTCGAVATILVRLSSRVVRDDDGSGSLGVRGKVGKIPHLCGQMALELENLDRDGGGA